MLTKNASEHDGDFSEYLKRYRYQPELTSYLDKVSTGPFSQEIINEIVLWKVNRFAKVPEDLLSELYTLKELKAGEHRRGEAVLLKLLKCKGVAMPMASTILRFQNADVFQIIDRQAYRAVFQKAYVATKQIGIYFEYLEEVQRLAASRNVKFRDLDRILYQFDKEQNGPLK